MALKIWSEIWPEIFGVILEYIERGFFLEGLFRLNAKEWNFELVLKKRRKWMAREENKQNPKTGAKFSGQSTNYLKRERSPG